MKSDGDVPPRGFGPPPAQGNSRPTDIGTSPATTRIGVVAAITAVEPSWLFIRST